MAIKYDDRLTKILENRPDELKEILNDLPFGEIIKLREQQKELEKKRAKLLRDSMGHI